MLGLNKKDSFCSDWFNVGKNDWVKIFNMVSVFKVDFDVDVFFSCLVMC